VVYSFNDRRPVARTPLRRTLLAYERPAFSDTLLRSFGVRVWSYVVSVIADDRIRNWVVEWRPPTFETATGALFLVSVVAVALFVGSR